MDAPAHKASCTSFKRPSRGTFITLSNLATSIDFGSWDQSNTASLRSIDRNAFCKLSVKLRPIAIASPTDFIVVVSV